MVKNENLKSKLRYTNVIFFVVWIVFIFLINKFNLSYKFIIAGFVLTTVIEGLICAYIRKNEKS